MAVHKSWCQWAKMTNYLVVGRSVLIPRFFFFFFVDVVYINIYQHTPRIITSHTSTLLCLLGWMCYTKHSVLPSFFFRVFGRRRNNHQITIQVLVIIMVFLAAATATVAAVTLYWCNPWHNIYFFRVK